MEQAFGYGADFGYMTDRPVFVSEIFQHTRIGVDEKGVEGGAATVVLMEETAAEEPETAMTMILNRPFLYGLYSNDGGWILIGTVWDPFV